MTSKQAKQDSKTLRAAPLPELPEDKAAVASASTNQTKGSLSGVEASEIAALLGGVDNTGSDKFKHRSFIITDAQKSAMAELLGLIPRK